MNKKTQIIISLTGIIIVLFILVGFTYGYYLTNITGNSSATSISIETGIAGVEYTDLTGDELDDIIIEPGTTLTKKFKVTNTGNVKASYSIYLVDVINNFNRKQDITYKLYRIGNTETFPESYENCTELTESEKNITSDISGCKIIVGGEEDDAAIFPSELSVIKPNEIIYTPNNSYTYAMVITYKDHPTENQDADQGKTFSGKINLRPTDKETNPFSEGTLAYNILNNGAELLDTTNNEKYFDKTYTEKTTVTKVADGSDREDMGIFTAPDDYGTSYYYRGTVKNNYVEFAGFTWRIVRINGNGSVRLILDGTLDKIKRKNEDVSVSTEVSGSKGEFNIKYNDNAYVGYMYGNFTTISTSYEQAHKNENDSTIKDRVDLFYEKYIESEANNYHYEKYLADTLFCGDKTLASNGTGGISNASGFGNSAVFYSATQRIIYSSTTYTTTSTPTLECASNEYETNKNLTEEQRAYSRYTSKKDMSKTTTKGVLVNNDLNYPIALLSADELVMAGGWGGSGTTANNSYYLYDAYGYETPTLTDYWGTMTPCAFNGGRAYEFVSFVSTNSLNAGNVDSNLIGTRPVINLKADNIVSGDGTSENPYTIQESN